MIPRERPSSPTTLERPPETLYQDEPYNGGAAKPAAAPRRRPPANPFHTPSDGNCDLSFLAVEDALLVYAVDHYENIRRLRDAVVFEHMNARDKSSAAWRARIDAASVEFRPEPWMRPVSELQHPAVINGIFDYAPIAETCPELYDAAKRGEMRANGQCPWVIQMTLNTGRHSGEAFLDWVHAELIPRIVRSAREITLHHFREPDGGEKPRRRRIRAITTHNAPVKSDLNEKRLRARLFALACHRIRFGAPEGESAEHMLERYRAALPAGVSDEVTPEIFARRVRSVVDTAREEWVDRIGEARFRKAVEAGWIRKL